MILKKIGLSGITVFDNFELDLSDLPEGVVAITGENGSGKTTLLEAICLVLAGDAPSREAVSIFDICNKKDCQIEIEYKLNDDTYRHLVNIDSVNRKQEGYIWINGVAVVDGKISNYKKYCEENIINSDMWYSCYFNSQNNKGNFLTIPTSDRKKIMIDSLGLKKLSQLSQSAKNKRGELNSELDKLDFEINSYQLSLNSIGDISDINKTKENIDLLQNEINVLKADITDGEGKIRIKEGNLAKINNDKDKILKELQYYVDIENKIKALNKQSSELSIEITSIGCDQYDKKKGELKEAELELKKLQNNFAQPAVNMLEIEQKYMQLFKNIDDNFEITQNKHKILLEEENNAKHKTEIAKKELVDQYENKLLERNKIQDLINQDKNKLTGTEIEIKNKETIITRNEEEASLLKDLKCADDDTYECSLKDMAIEARNAILPLKDALALLEKEKEELISSININNELSVQINNELGSMRGSLSLYDGKLDTCNNTINELNKRLNQANDKVKLQKRELTTQKDFELNELNNQKNDFDNKLKCCNDNIDRTRLEIKEIENKINTLDQQKQKIYLEVENYEHTLTRRPEDLEYPQDLEDDINDISCDISDLKIGLKEKLLLLECHAKELDILRAIVVDTEVKTKQLNEFKSKLKVANKSKNELNETIKLYLQIETAFGANGIQALEIDNAGPEISELANSLLRECFDDRFVVEFITTKKKISDGQDKEVFTVMIFDSITQHEGDIKEFSGGERTIITIAIQLALALFSANRIDKKFKTLIFDEITSSLSDDNGGLCTKMLERARLIGNFHHVFFSSHNLTAIELSNIIIEMGNGSAERIK